MTTSDVQNRVNGLIRTLRRIEYMTKDHKFVKAFNAASELDRAIVMLHIQNHDVEAIRFFMESKNSFKLEDLTIHDLRLLSSGRGVQYYAMKNKEELIEELKK